MAPVVDSWCVKGLAINFDTPDVTAGEEVRGALIFTVTHPMRFNYVSLKFVGKEQACIEERFGSGKHRRSEWHKGSRNTFKVYLVLLGCFKGRFGSGAKEFEGVLAPGEYKFPFAVRVPLAALPTMRAGFYAGTAVSYHAKATFGLPFYCHNAREGITVPFSVTVPLPQNQLDCARPYASDGAVMVKHTCCCCIGRGSSALTITLNSDTLLVGPGAKPFDGCVTIDNALSREEVPAGALQVVLIERSVISVKEHRRVSAAVVGTASPLNPQETVGVGAAGGHHFRFSLDLGEARSYFDSPVGTVPFRGAYIVHGYALQVRRGEDVWAEVEVICGPAADRTNRADPVLPLRLRGEEQRTAMDSPAEASELLHPPTVPEGEYPRFLYAPPPGVEALHTVPFQRETIGPFPGSSNVAVFQYESNDYVGGPF